MSTPLGAFRGSERFRVVESLGSGATGEVFHVVDRESEARVALKALRQASPEHLRLFKHEFRAMQDIRHENLVSLGELFEEGGQWFFTMDLVEGRTDLLGYVSHHRAKTSQSLDTHVALRFASDEGAKTRAHEEPGVFDEQRLRGALRQLVAGLRALHAAGKVHRDVKPSNVLVTKGGRVVIVDFGILMDRRERRGEGDENFSGTPAYMAPEQAVSNEIGPAADWYAVGVVLFEALTRRLPFEGSVTEMLTKKVSESGPSPGQFAPNIPPDLNELCEALLKLDPSHRPTGDEIARRLGLDEGDTEKADVAQIFVGRQAELAALHDAYALVRGGGSVVVLVEGESGVGKSELVRHFIDELEKTHPDTLVLRGRSYERESIPYEALDDALDDLSRTLERSEWADARVFAALSPRDVAMLGRTFPVLRGVLGTPSSSAFEEAPSPRQQRAQLFEATRRMMSGLAGSRPVVLSIDDLHWADGDSIALLAELFRAPDEPKVMLLCTLRTESAVRSKAIDVTRTIVDGARATRTVRIGKLPLADAETLARGLFKMRDVDDVDPSNESLQRILAEAQGHPLFIDELVRRQRTEGEATRGVQLDDVLWQRVRSLTPDARRLLEHVAVVGMPVSQELVARAGAIAREGVADAVRELQHARMIRTSGARGAPLLAPYHDRIRESVVARLDDESLRAAHAHLAVAGEQAKGCDAEFLLAHWAGAGNAKRAGEYARTAADRAASTLAFDHAASLYRRAIASGAFESTEVRALQGRLADVLTAAGRGAEAAEIHLELSGDATTTEGLDLRRQAAEQFLFSGHFDRGKALLRDVILRVRERFPDSTASVIFWLLLARLQLWLRGIAFTVRAPDAQDERALARMDALSSAGFGFSMTDNTRAVYFQTRNLLLVLDAGDLRRAARSLAMEVCFRATSGTKAAPKTLAYLAVARGLAERVGTPDALALADSAEGYASFFVGDWTRSITAYSRAEAVFRDRCVGVHYLINSTRTMLFRALAWAGRIHELRERASEVLRDAVQRGDKHTVQNIECSASLLVALADDRVADARRLLDEVKRDLPTDGFIIQHYFHLAAEVQLELYAGRSGEAYARLEATAASIRRSVLSRIAILEVQRRGLFARCALASAEADSSKRWIAEARRHVASLRRIGVPFARPIANLHAAGVLACEGERTQAVALLRTAVEELDAAGLRCFAMAGRRRLAKMVGGDEGATLASVAQAFETAEGIVDGEAFARLHAPGFGRYASG